MATVEKYQTATGMKWRVRYRKPNGTQTDKRGFATKRDAELFKSSVEVAKAHGSYIDPSRARTTVGELGERWISSRSHLKPSSNAVYESAWRIHVKPRWHDATLAEIEHSDVQAWIGELATRKSASLVRRCHDILSGILQSAVNDRRMLTNPASGVKLPAKVPREHTYLTHTQVDLLAQAADRAGNSGHLVNVLAYTGLRWGELSALRVKDVDLARRRITVAQNAVFVAGTIVVGTPKTGKNREVPFPAFLTPVLKSHTSNKIGDALVFPNAHGTHMVTPTIRDRSWWDRALEIANLPASMTIHDLRHTAVSLAIQGGANVRDVQNMVGHSKPAMTLNVYSHLFPDSLNDVADALDAQRAAMLAK